MSLLLEALKKAEKAKEEAQRRARGEAGPASELRLEGDAPATASSETAAPARPDPVMTRDQLPDIRQPLEIERDSPPAAARAAAASTESPRPQPRADAQAAERESQRNSARKVFEAKFKEPNPRLPFYITVGALGVFALGTVAYSSTQLRPAPALVNANPPRPTGEAQVAAADTRPSTTPAASPQASASPSAIPGLPSSAPVPAPAKAAPQGAITPPPERAPVRPAERALPPERPLIKTIPQPLPAEPEVCANRSNPNAHPKVH